MHASAVLPAVSPCGATAAGRGVPFLTPSLLSTFQLQREIEREIEYSRYSSETTPRTAEAPLDSVT